jgi:hypothetical protein
MKRIFVLIVFFAVLLVFAGPGLAVEGMELIYSEDFSSGNLPANSTITQGSWTIETEDGNNYLHGEAYQQTSRMN